MKLKVRITEKELRQAIKNSIVRLFGSDEIKPLLYEYYYATKRGDFIKTIMNNMIPMIQHGCLIIYASNMGQETYIKHWSDEVSTFLRNMVKKTVSGVNGIEGLKTAIHQAFMKGDFYNISTIQSIAKQKFKHEYKKVNEALFEQSCQALLSTFSHLENVIASFDQNEIDKYAQSLKNIKL